MYHFWLHVSSLALNEDSILVVKLLTIGFYLVTIFTLDRSDVLTWGEPAVCGLDVHFLCLLQQDLNFQTPSCTQFTFKVFHLNEDSE